MEKNKRQSRYRMVSPTTKKRNKIIKEALGELIGPTEIAPELLMWIKEIQVEQKRVTNEVLSCRMQFKALEHLRLEDIKDELKDNEEKFKKHSSYLNEYVDAIQSRIDEMENKMRKY